jgi:hypothetical protein
MIAKIKKINENLEKQEKQLEVPREFLKGYTTRKRRNENKTKAATKKRNRFQKKISKEYIT